MQYTNLFRAKSEGERTNLLLCEHIARRTSLLLAKGRAQCTSKMLGKYKALGTSLLLNEVMSPVCFFFFQEKPIIAWCTRLFSQKFTKRCTSPFRENIKHCVSVCFQANAYHAPRIVVSEKYSTTLQFCFQKNMKQSKVQHSHKSIERQRFSTAISLLSGKNWVASINRFSDEDKSHLSGNILTRQPVVKLSY